MPKFSEQKDTFVRRLAATQTHTAPSAAPMYLSVGIFMRETKMETCRRRQSKACVDSLIRVQGDTAERFNPL